MIYFLTDNHRFTFKIRIFVSILYFCIFIDDKNIIFYGVRKRKRFEKLHYRSELYFLIPLPITRLLVMVLF